jgi:hypothetical protein
MAPPAETNKPRAKTPPNTGTPSPELKPQPAFTNVKAGPGGQSILLPDSQLLAWEALVESVHQKFSPEPGLEERLVQAIVHNEWRLARSIDLRAALDQLAQQNKSGLSPAEHRKSLKNLLLQEKRLRLYLKLDTAELSRLQTDRQNSRRHQLFLVPKREKY